MTSVQRANDNNSYNIVFNYAKLISSGKPIIHFLSDSFLSILIFWINCSNTIHITVIYQTGP